MAKQQQQSTTTRIISFLGVYLMTCLWSISNLDSSCQNNSRALLAEPHKSHHHGRRASLASNNNELPSTKQQYNFTAAICVCIKDAEAYFEEFLDYHLAMGFSNIYLYDDSPNFELQHWYQNTRADPTYSKVQVLHFPDIRETFDSNAESSNDDDDDDDETQAKEPQLPIDPQTEYYEDCVQRFGLRGPKHDYFAFIDVDEFFVLQDDTRFDNMLDVLQEYLVPFGGALTVNWMLVGSANKSVYAPLPVTKRFQYRDDKTHYVIKSIVKTSDYLGHRNPHAVWVTNTTDIHTTDYPGALHKGASSPRGATDNKCPSKVVLLYHYRYTSDKEYIFKRCTRGGTDGGHYWCTPEGKIRQDYGPKHIQSIPGSVLDDKAWKFLTSHVPKYKLFNSFQDFH